MSDYYEHKLADQEDAMKDQDLLICEMQNEIDKGVIREKHLKKHAESVFKDNEVLEEKLRIATEALQDISDFDCALTGIYREKAFYALKKLCELEKRDKSTRGDK